MLVGAALLAFVLAVQVGPVTLAWYCTLAVGVALAGRWIGPRLLRCTDMAVGAGLLAFGGVLGYRVAGDA